MLWIKKFTWINVITLFLYLFDFNSPEKHDRSSSSSEWGSGEYAKGGSHWAQVETTVGHTFLVQIMI